MSARRTALWLTTSTVLAVIVAVPAKSQVRQFDIQAGNLKTALDAFARQSGRQLIYRSDEVRGSRTAGVRGRRRVEDALAALLAGSNFTSRTGPSGAIAIVRSGRSASERSKEQIHLSTPDGTISRPTTRIDIVVTGSRIPQPNLEWASPVTVITSQEVKLSGTSRTEDLINSLPQAYAAQGANISNGATGTATVNLRGLGESRTLVLVNGKRLQAGDMLFPYADINFIPAALIDRVDVLTGGASSAYGADAVAGVVNFVLDTKQTGLRIDAQTSVFNHRNKGNDDIIEANDEFGLSPPRGWSTNGGAQDIAGVFGANWDDDRGHVTAYATYRTQKAVVQSSRDYSFCALVAASQSLIDSLQRRFTCGGPMTSASGTFVQVSPATKNTIDIFHVSDHAFVSGFTSFNPAPYNYFQRPDERYNLGAFADYEISPAFNAYLEAMYMDDESVSQIAPSGNFGDTTVIACDNALLSAEQVARICAPGKTIVAPLNGQTGIEQALIYVLRRNAEGGGRDDVIGHRASRFIGGIRGEVARGLSYDAFYQRGRTIRSSTYLNDFSITRLGRAIDAVAVLDGEIVAPGTPGATIVCRAAFTGIDPACVPWNIFQEGGVTPEALAYLQTPGFQEGIINETIAHADVTVTGDEYGWRMPWAETGVGLNVGAEYRKEVLDFQVDQAFATGDLAGQRGQTPPVKGEFDVRELFAEVQLPIVQNNFIDEFVINAGYRFSNYHVAGNSFNTDTYKIAGELAPIPDIRFRASYNRAVRAPNIAELFFPPSLGISDAADPCSNQFGSGSPLWTVEQCQLTGVTPALYGHILANSSGQYNSLFGGNPELLPEKADTLTAGMIVRPRFVPGLALTADYFDIKVKNVISASGFLATLESCAGINAPSDPSACARIHRGPGGSLWLNRSGFIDLTNQNFPGVALVARGFDFQGTYSRALAGFGTISGTFLGTYVTKLRAPGVFADCAGLFGGTCGTPNPRWRHRLRLSLLTPNGLGASAAWRHFSGVYAQPATNPGDARLNAVDYFDLALTARVSERSNLRLGANNLFDREPPIAGGVVGVVFGNGNTYPQVYDALGRYVFAGFDVSF